MLVDPASKLRPEPRDRLEELFGRDRAAQALELGPAAGADHLRDRRGERRPDARQRIEAFDALALEQHRHILIQSRDRAGGPPVGGHPKRVCLLVLEQLGRLAQPLRDALIAEALRSRARADAVVLLVIQRWSR